MIEMKVGRLVTEAFDKAFIRSFLMNDQQTYWLRDGSNRVRLSQIIGIYRVEHGRLDWCTKWRVGSFGARFNQYYYENKRGSIREYAISEFKRIWIVSMSGKSLEEKKIIFPSRGEIILSMINPDDDQIDFNVVDRDSSVVQNIIGHTVGVFRCSDKLLIWAGRVCIDGEYYGGLATEEVDKFGTLKIYKL